VPRGKKKRKDGTTGTVTFSMVDKEFQTFLVACGELSPTYIASNSQCTEFLQDLYWKCNIAGLIGLLGCLIHVRIPNA
jgi:hypothetical protein